MRAAAWLVPFAVVACASSPPAVPAATVTVPAAAPAAPPSAAAKAGASSLHLGPRIRVLECNAMIGIINRAVEALAQGSDDAGGAANGVADLRAMATTMDRVATETAELSLTVPELVKFNAEYRKMAKDVASAARAMATAAEAKDLAKLKQTQEAMEKAVKREDPLVEAINAFCQAR
jgi:hypothetical protein